jgi:glyoxylase-like metal-dependent hydrolase (beta-lactamase superfamily II)
VKQVSSPAAAATAPYRPRRIQAGSWRVTALSDGFFRLDGGAMWGVVPKNLWASLTPPHADNTIRMALRPFLAERGADKVVIEVGVGQRWEEKWRRIYGLEPTTTLEQSLRACGVEPEQVTHVVASHCHWDHIGAAVVERNGQLEALFSKAKHFAPRIEIEMAKKPGHARKGSYRADDVTPLERAGRLEAYEGEFEVLPGLVAHPLGGHSDGVSVIVLDGESTDPQRPGAIFWSDVVPTTHHIQPPYIMAYDIDVVRSFEQRSAWLERAAGRGWTGLFYHDEHHAFGRIERDGKRYRLQVLEGDA